MIIIKDKPEFRVKTCGSGLFIFYEQSPKEFHAFPKDNIHRSKQQTDTGLEIGLLQEFI